MTHAAKNNTFGNCFDGVRIIPSHVQGYVCGAEACCGHQSRRIGFAKSFLLQRWQQLRTCHCVSNFKKMYGEGPLTFLMAASRDEQLVQQRCQDYENRSLNVEQMCWNEPAQQRAEADARQEQIASELTGYMMSRAVAEQEILNLRKELSEANAKLKNAANANMSLVTCHTLLMLRCNISLVFLFSG